MGLIRKLLKPLTRETEQMVVQARAILKQDKIEHGEKILAPKHPTDDAHFKSAQKDEKIKEEVARRRDDLIQKVNEINIKSFDPPERPKSGRPLPTRESEYDHVNDPKHEYGFYEPPLDKMQPGKLTLREAIDLLYAKTEIDLEGTEVEHAKNVLQTHPATSRIGSENIDNLYQYYRPFVRKDVQHVVNKYDLETLSDYMNNRDDYQLDVALLTIEGARTFNSKVKTMVREKLGVLESQEKREILENIDKRRFEERMRLESKLQEEFADMAESKDGKESDPPPKK